MLNLLNKFSRTFWKPVCQGKANVYNIEIPIVLNKGISVRAYSNISNPENKIEGAIQNIKILNNAFGLSNRCIKEYVDCVWLSNYHKCNFHSSSSLFVHSNNYGGHGKYQEEEKRKVKILIWMGLFLVLLLIWGNYKMDLSPYDKITQ